MTPLLVLLLGTVAATAGWFVLTRRRVDAWRSFAASRQLSFNTGRIAGVVNGFTIAMLIESRGENDQVAVVRCSLEGVFPPRFSISRETLVDKLAQLATGPDHQLGVPEIDSAFLIEHLSEDARRVLNQPAVQRVLLRTVRQYPGMRIAKGVLQLEAARAPTTEEELASMLSDAVALANLLTRARAEARPISPR